MHDSAQQNITRCDFCNAGRTLHEKHVCNSCIDELTIPCEMFVCKKIDKDLKVWAIRVMQELCQNSNYDTRYHEARSERLLTLIESMETINKKEEK